MNPQGKTALITGGARRVGKAITLALAEAGANVVINYRSDDEAVGATAAEASALGVETMLAKGDVADYESVKTQSSEALKRFGAVDILVNNASMYMKTPFPTDDITLWHQVTNILINGPFYWANALAPKMMEGGDGVIINIVDISIHEPWPEYTAHTVGKSALLALTRQLALDLAPAVKVNAIAPGPVLPSPHHDDEKIKRIAGKTLLEKWGNPRDVSRAVLFIVESDFMTGEVITIDGGERYGHRKKEEG